MNPETQQYEHSQFELTRGSAQALRDFAPGSTFYANGFAIDIDAVDLGANGEEVAPWACCPKCGFVKELSDHHSGDGVPDRVPTLWLAGDRRHQPAHPRHRADQRLGHHPPRRSRPSTMPTTNAPIERFTVVTARRHRLRRRHQTLVRRQTRLRRQAPARLSGAVDQSGPQRGLAVRLGYRRRSTSTPPCSGCAPSAASSTPLTGAEQAAVNTVPGARCASRHEESTRTSSLARSMLTEGLRAAAAAVDDAWATTSPCRRCPRRCCWACANASAAIPIICRSCRTVDPPQRAERHPAAAARRRARRNRISHRLHQPATVWDLLHRAWKVVRTAPASTTGELACERCLLPYPPCTTSNAPPVRLPSATSPACLPDTSSKLAKNSSSPTRCRGRSSRTNAVLDEPESNLEKRFRVVFADRLKALGATVAEKPPTQRGRLGHRPGSRQPLDLAAPGERAGLQA